LKTGCLELTEEQIQKARELTKRYRDLLAIGLPKDHLKFNKEMVESQKVRECLEAMGFHVTWKASFNPAGLSKDPPEVDVEVTLWVPKSNFNSFN
jgi:hypothetical protein